MVSTLLYPNDINHTRDISKNNFQLDKRRKVFEMVENAIVGLGMSGYPSFLFSSSLMTKNFIIVPFDCIMMTHKLNPVWVTCHFCGLLA